MRTSMATAHYENAGAIMLSLQPPELKAPQPTYPNWDTLYAHLQGRYGMLRTWRYSWWAHWARLAQFILPHRYHWVITANTMNRGNPVNEQIIDNTPTLAMRICAAGLSAGLMSPSRPWFRLGIALPNFELDNAAQVWLDDSTERILAVLGGSNVYTEAAQMFQDVATFGTSPMIIYEDHRDVIRAYVPVAGEYYLATGARLSVDTLYREYVYTISQIVDWFGLENCPDEVRKLWREGGASLENERIVMHAIEPNFALHDRARGGKVNVLPGNFPYREVYWLKGMMGNGPLSLRGFNEAPFMVARWSKTSNDAYGRGPGMDCLGDSGQLQQEQLRKGEFIDKGVRPPMGADPDLEHRPSSILPGEITYVDTRSGQSKGFWPLYQPEAAWMMPLTKDIESVEQRINRAFFTDVFLIITQMEGIQPKNQLELAMRQGEKIQMLGPVIELFESEFASPMIQRVVSIMQRRGMFKPLPPSLRGLPIKIEYISLMKMAQRAAETGSMERGAQVIASISPAAVSAGLPTPARIINWDEWARIYLDRLGFPARALHSQTEVDEADHQRLAQAQAQQLAQLVPPTAQAAESLSQVDIGGGQTAIQAMLGTQPAGNA